MALDQDAISFRRAREADLPAIVALLADDVLGSRREDVGETQDLAYLAAFHAIMADTNQYLAVADHQGEVVGCMQLSFIPGLSRRGLWRGQIESVRVAASARGMGLGGRFFEWAFMQCRARGCGIVQLTTDKRRADAQRFYTSLGFVASHEGMKRELS